MMHTFQMTVYLNRSIRGKTAIDLIERGAFAQF